MKYIKQFGIILGITFIGEVLKYILPLQLPASIYGLILMFVALIVGVIKVDQVKDAAELLIEIMPIMFIPAGVGLLDSWQALKSICLPVIFIIVVSTVVVMAVSGRVTQFILRLGKGMSNNERNIK